MTKIKIASLVILLFSASVQAQYGTYDYWDKNYTVQALLGAVQFENLKIDNTSGTGDPVEVDVSLVPQLGAAWGTLPGEGRFQLGLEASFLLGFRLDTVNAASIGGSGLYVSISTSMWMFDLAGGPYANLFLDKKKRVRLYGGVGPLMTYVDYRSERKETDTDEEVYDTNESVFGIGVYARAGVEFRIYEYGMLGVGARGTWSNVDFSDVGGNSELVGGAAFVSFTAGF